MDVCHQKEQRKVLATSCLIEMGERYVFYTIQSLLIFYLIDSLHLVHASSTKLAGTVFGMEYISALAGGYIAERFLTYYLAAFIGSLVLILGCLMMTIVHSEDSLFLGIAFISTGSGLVKSNVSAFVGKFYDAIAARESQRDFGFNIFYMGINAGITAATFFAFYLRDKYGFSGTFYVSLVVSVAVALITSVGFVTLKDYQRDRLVTTKSFFYAWILIAFYIAFVFGVLKSQLLANLMFFMVVVMCGVVLVLSSRNQQSKRVFAALIFFGLSTLYWALYMQLFISILLFIHFCVQHHFIGVGINTTQFVSFESISVLLLGVVIGKIWIYFENKNHLVPDIDKFNAAFWMLGVMFLCLYLGITFSVAGEKVAAGFVLLAVFFMGASELALSAIGLSMVTKIAPAGYVSLYMGIWLATIGVGSKLAGQMASFIVINDHLTASKQIMAHGLIYFMLLCVVGILLALAFRKPTLFQLKN